jgi:hypothetical protein
VDLPSHLLPLAALYPEIHYRFRFLPFSRYFRRQPEIISDAPHRLEPGQSLPILLLVKDADRYPVELREVELQARCRDRQIVKKVTLDATITIRWWHHIEGLELPDESPAQWEITVIWSLRRNRREYRVINDNLPGLSHRPLTVNYSGHGLPRQAGWYFGDLHAHTAYTEDQVEFGAPLAVYPEMSRAQGLSFACAADHAYDLDNQPDSLFRHDPALHKFHARAAEMTQLNERGRDQFVLLPGFELTVANHLGRNVHLLMLGQEGYLPGSGDSAEKWLRTKTELRLPEALQRLTPNALAFAAHPSVRPPFLQRRLLGRGAWEGADFKISGLHGLQVWNGEMSEEFQRGVDDWVGGLLEGKRWKIIAGSDAHGNFNRYRQVGFPMIRLEESNRHVFGAVRTGVFIQGELSAPKLLSALREQPSFISDGPFAKAIVLKSERENCRIQSEALSSPEFGGLAEVKVYWGKVGAATEKILVHEHTGSAMAWERVLPLTEKGGYVRMEVRTDKGRRCLTNPIFVSDPSP